MKIQNRHLFSLMQSLSLLDRYKLNPEDGGKTRYALARNARTVRDMVDDLQSTRLRMIRDAGLEVLKEAGPDGKPVEIVLTHTPAGQKFATDWQALMMESTDVNLCLIDCAQLKPDEIGLPVEIIAGLLPMLRNFPEAIKEGLG